MFQVLSVLAAGALLMSSTAAYAQQDTQAPDDRMADFPTFSATVRSITRSIEQYQQPFAQVTVDFQNNTGAPLKLAYDPTANGGTFQLVGTTAGDINSSIFPGYPATDAVPTCCATR